MPHGYPAASNTNVRPYFIEHMNSPEISIVIPTYNSEAFVEASLRTLCAFLETNDAPWGSSEIVVVDDGSTDRTAEIVQQEFPNLQLLIQPQNQGKGAAVRRGMTAATGRYRFFIDADIPFSLEVLPSMYTYLAVKEFDLCIGTRRAQNAHEFARPSRLRRLSSALFTLFVSRLVVTGVRDTQCGLKGLRAEAANYLFRECRTNGFAFDVEILYLAYKNDLDVKRHPVNLVRNDSSTVSVFRQAPKMLFSVLLLPIRYYGGRYTMMQSENGA